MTVDIRRLTPADGPAVLGLADAAGWNQTAADVARLLDLDPDGAFAACRDGRVIGTTTTTTYGTALAWVGMVLVDPVYRRQGVATTLMRAALDHLRRRGIGTVMLDATPAGRPVYERLGFEPAGTLERWTGEAPPPPVEAVPVGTWDDVADLDRPAFGVDRGRLIRRLLADTGGPLWVEPGPAGFALARPGSRAGYLGPIVADTVVTAGKLLAAAMAGRAGPLFVDIDTAFPGAVELVRGLGWTRQRELLRMRLGPAIKTGGPRRVFAIAGPEVG